MTVPTSLDAKKSEDERTTALAFWAAQRQPGWDEGGKRQRTGAAEKEQRAPASDKIQGGQSRPT